MRFTDDDDDNGAGCRLVYTIVVVKTTDETPAAAINANLPAEAAAALKVNPPRRQLS